MNSKLDYLISFGLGMCAAEAVRLYMIDDTDIFYLITILVIAFIHYRFFYR